VPDCFGQGHTAPTALSPTMRSSHSIEYWVSSLSILSYQLLNASRYLLALNDYFFEDITLPQSWSRSQPGARRAALPAPLAKSSRSQSSISLAYTRYTYATAVAEELLNGRIQLLRLGWFPASLKTPETTFTSIC